MLIYFPFTPSSFADELANVNTSLDKDTLIGPLTFSGTVTVTVTVSPI